MSRRSILSAKERSGTASSVVTLSKLKAHHIRSSQLCAHSGHCTLSVVHAYKAPSRFVCKYSVLRAVQASCAFYRSDVPNSYWYQHLNWSSIKSLRIYGCGILRTAQYIKAHARFQRRRMAVNYKISILLCCLAFPRAILVCAQTRMRSNKILYVHGEFIA